MSTVIEAAHALLGRCDGAVRRDDTGYNGADAPFVRSMLAERKWLTGRQLQSLHKLLRKYSNQLSLLGYYYPELIVPAPGPKTSATGATGTKSQQMPGSEAAVASSTPPIAAPPARPSAPPPWPFTPEEVLRQFPGGYDPRPQQLTAIKKISDAFKAGKRVVILEMPTGGGKSFICQSVAKAVATVGQTHFLTIQKQLQEQYLRDFPAPQIEVLKGRANYPCTLGGEHAANAPCTEQKRGILPECVKGGDVKGVMRDAVQLKLDPECHHCPYWKQLQKCHNNAITLFNFSSFLFQQRIGRFGKRQLLIIDEAHNIESQLMNFVSLELTEWALSIIGVKIDREITSKQALLDWMRETEISRKLDEALGDSDPSTEDSDTELSKIEHDALRELQGKIENFMTFLEKTQWVFDTVTYQARGRRSKKVQARPLYAKDFAEDLLFSKADRVLVMSATILDAKVWGRNLGLDPEEVALVQTPCEFPIENRPIHLEYAGNMGRKHFSDRYGAKNPTKPRFIEKVRQILKRHQGQRGLIHSHSFELSDILRNEVADSRFLFQQDFGGDKAAMLEVHANRPDSVIVAPAMAEGFDFKDDLARFQVIAKVPWPSLGDKVVKERANTDPKWYAWYAALRLIQSYGRVVRSSKDWGYTYIVDAGFEGFAARNRSMLPGWFMEACRKYAPQELRKV